MLEHKKLQRWTAPWNTLGASSFPTVNRYDDAGPNRNIVDRPDQQKSHHHQDLAILSAALLKSATDSVQITIFPLLLQSHWHPKAHDIPHVAQPDILRTTLHNKKVGP